MILSRLTLIHCTKSAEDPESSCQTQGSDAEADHRPTGDDSRVFITRRGSVWLSRRGLDLSAHCTGDRARVFGHVHVSRLLKALELTPQKPMERAAQRDEEKIVEWRKETWPDLKKSAARTAYARLY